MGERLDELEDKDIALYVSYASGSMQQGLKAVEGYFGKRPALFSTSNIANFQYSPDMMVVNLETMVPVSVPALRGLPTELRQSAHNARIDAAIEACESIE